MGRPILPVPRDESGCAVTGERLDPLTVYSQQAVQSVSAVWRAGAGRTRPEPPSWAIHAEFPQLPGHKIKKTESEGLGRQGLGERGAYCLHLEEKMPPEQGRQFRSSKSPEFRPIF